MFSEQQVRQKLKELRIEKGITEEQAANYLGRASNSSVNRIESGQTRLNFEIIEKLCTLYKVNPIDLFHVSKVQTPNMPVEKKGYLDRLMFRADTDASNEIKEKIKGLQPALRKLGTMQSKIEKTPISTYDIDQDYNSNIFNDPNVAKRYAATFANKLRKYFGLGDHSIVDVADICWKYLNIPICGLEMGDDVWGIYSRDRNDNPLIIYSLNAKYQQRNVFTIAHELGHHFFYKENLELDSGNDLHNADIYEKVANKFAQELLVPLSFLREKYDEMGFSLLKEIKPNHVVELCNFFKVSYQMMAYCLLQAQKINSADYDILREFGLNELGRKAKELDYKADTYLNINSSLSSRLEEVTLIALRTRKLSKLDATSILDITSEELLKKI